MKRKKKKRKNILHRTRGRKPNSIGHILRRNRILKHITEEKTEGMWTWGRRLNQLLDDPPYLRTPRTRDLPVKQQVLSESGNSPYFMETKGSLPHSQEPATCPRPEPDWSRSCPHNPLTGWLSGKQKITKFEKGSSSSRFPENSLWVRLRTCHMKYYTMNEIKVTEEVVRHERVLHRHLSRALPSPGHYPSRIACR